MKKRLAYIFALLFTFVVAFGVLSACTLPDRTINEYNVTIGEASLMSTTSATEVLARIRPTVVDVTSYGDEVTAAGSGVIISRSTLTDNEEYFVVTNHHVIEGGNVFAVDVLSIDNGTESTTSYNAILVGSSKKRDIAVLAFFTAKGTQLSTATFIQDSDVVKVGTEVYAIGNPLGILGGTVTHGIVSATKRQVSVEEVGTMTLMQTDASINGGNSGGGLFDTDGILIGIINSGYDTYNEQSVEGLNFAIPANDAKYAAASIIETHTEENGTVTSYGYVEGDANLSLTVSAATLYTSSALISRSNYLTLTAASDSPFYSAWGGSTKAVTSVKINGAEVSLPSDGSAYSLIAAASDALLSVQAGDSVTVVYRDIYSSNSFLGRSRSYVDGTEKTLTVTASQYVYRP